MINNLVKIIKDLIKSKDNIYILGHKNCDVDSFLSGVLLSNYLNFLNINAKFIIKDKKLDDGTIELLEQLDYEPYEYLSDIDLTNENVILVDHNKPFFNCNVIGCIDHHSFEENNYSFSIIEKIGSTCSIIHNLIEILNDYFKPYYLDNYQLKDVLYSIVIDTNGLRSDKCTTSDLIKIDFIKFQLNISTTGLENIIDETTICTDLIKPMEEIIHNGYKEYYINDIIVKSSYIEIKKDNQNIVKECIDYIKTYKPTFWVFIVINYKDLTTTVFYINNDKSIEKKHNKIISRGSNIIPHLEKELKKQTIINLDELKL